MSNFMQHMAKLQQIWMTWQGPAPQRKRFVVARIGLDHGQVSFAYDTDSPDFEMARKVGFEGYPAFPDFAKKYNKGVKASLASRLPPKTRSDYPDFLRHWFMNPQDDPGIFEVLAYSGGELPRDSFGFVPVFSKGTFDFVTELAGYHYYLRESKDRQPEKIGDALKLVIEPDNSHDPRAVKLVMRSPAAEDRIVGYLKRGLNWQAQQWIKQGTVRSRIARLNGSAQRPLCYAHLWVEWPG